MNLESKIEGFDELADLMKLLPAKVENRVAQKSVNSAMRAGRDAVKAAAPVFTGAQRSPISIKFGGLKKNVRLVRLKKAQKGQKGARVDTGNAPQGFWYEKGTRYQPARPWFLPAISRAREEIFRILGLELGAGIEEEAKK